MKTHNPVARKEHKCQHGCDIVPGDKYYWFQRRNMSKKKFCINHPPKPSETTTSDKLATLYNIQENLTSLTDSFRMNGIDVDTLKDDIQSAADEAREVSEEYEESASNMEEYFQGSSKVDEIRESGESAEAFATELEDCCENIDGVYIEGDEENKLSGPNEEQIEEIVSFVEDALNSLDI